MRTKSSALNMPESKKQETLDAVFKALKILNKKSKPSRDFDVGIALNRKSFSMSNGFNMIASNAFIALVVGHSQQRRLKRYSRRSDVFLESLKIAEETGANIGEIREDFMSKMYNYISTEK